MNLRVVVLLIVVSAIARTSKATECIDSFDCGDFQGCCREKGNTEKPGFCIDDCASCGEPSKNDRDCDEFQTHASCDSDFYCKEVVKRGLTYNGMDVEWEGCCFVEEKSGQRDSRCVDECDVCKSFKTKEPQRVKSSQCTHPPEHERDCLSNYFCRNRKNDAGQLFGFQACCMHASSKRGRCVKDCKTECDKEAKEENQDMACGAVFVSGNFVIIVIGVIIGFVEPQ